MHGHHSNVYSLGIVDDVHSLGIVDNVYSLGRVDNVYSLGRVDNVYSLGIVDDVHSLGVVDSVYSLGIVDTVYSLGIADLGKAHESVQQGGSQEQGLLVQLILASHLHKPADHNHAHGLVNIVLGLVVCAMVLHVVRVW